MEDDNVSLPHQQSFSSVKTDSDYIYQVDLIRCNYSSFSLMFVSSKVSFEQYFIEHIL